MNRKKKNDVKLNLEEFFFFLYLISNTCINFFISVLFYHENIKVIYLKKKSIQKFFFSRIWEMNKLNFMLVIVQTFTGSCMYPVKIVAHFLMKSKSDYTKLSIHRAFPEEILGISVGNIRKLMKEIINDFFLLEWKLQSADSCNCYYNNTTTTDKLLWILELLNYFCNFIYADIYG